MLPYPSLVSRKRSKKADRAKTAVRTVRCQGIFAFDNTRARKDHRASSLPFLLWRARSATGTASPPEFFPIECLWRSKNFFLSRGSRGGSYSLDNRALLLCVFLRVLGSLLCSAGAERETPTAGTQKGRVYPRGW